MCGCGRTSRPRLSGAINPLTAPGWSEKAKPGPEVLARDAGSTRATVRNRPPSARAQAGASRASGIGLARAPAFWGVFRGLLCCGGIGGSRKSIRAFCSPPAVKAVNCPLAVAGPPPKLGHAVGDRAPRAMAGQGAAGFRAAIAQSKRAAALRRGLAERLWRGRYTLLVSSDLRCLCAARLAPCPCWRDDRSVEGRERSGRRLEGLARAGLAQPRLCRILRSRANARSSGRAKCRHSP